MWRSRRLVLAFTLIALAGLPWWWATDIGSTAIPQAFSGTRGPDPSATSLGSARSARAAAADRMVSLDRRTNHRRGVPANTSSDEDTAVATSAGFDKHEIGSEGSARSPERLSRNEDTQQASEDDLIPDFFPSGVAFEEPVEPERVELDSLRLPDGALSTRVTGMDYGAPRRLVLWRVDRSRAAPLARTASEPDGSFDFGQILVPTQGLRLVATADGETPEAWQRDMAQAFDPHQPGDR
jgi:hypothetical protein